MTTGFKYDVYPAFEMSWSNHSLAAILRRLLADSISGAERTRLVWCAAFLAAEEGYAVNGGSKVITITLPQGMIGLPFGATVYGAHAVEEFCEQQLEHIPPPNPEAMRYGAARFEEAPA